jgi:hypothetical protein
LALVLLHELLALALPTETLLKAHAHKITFYLEMQSTIVRGESLGIAFLMLHRSFKRYPLKTQIRRPIVN